MRRIPSSLLLSAAAALTLAVSGCGGPVEAGNGAVQAGTVPPVTVNSKAAALVPQDVARTGTLRVATNAPYEPFISFQSEGDTTKFKGLDYDLVSAVAATLDLKADFQQQPFDGLVPGLQAKKYDAVVGGITDNKERQAAATFVDYSASGTGILVQTGKESGIKDLKSLCGRQVAVQKASKQVGLLAAFAEKNCNGNGIAVTEYPQNTDAFNAVRAGKAEAFVATKINLLDIAAKVNGQAKVLDDPSAPNGYEASPNGVGFLRDQAGLAKAFQAGLQELMDNGTYAAILGKWGQETIGIKEATIDAAID
ncbi:ABC transporter substrate-binding protein [Paenarthrobacter sp. S56]|uniref:ABC transporter substrate-binding protein n=1 Tax=Paenarthrobacter sp. S56 TaxID=3138179 RepID=UPI00321C23AF